MAQHGGEEEPTSETRGEIVPRPDAEPAPLDPETLRQFQQFQQFQEFQRAQESAAGGEEVAPPPEKHRTLPGWLTGVAGKLATAFLVLAAVIVGGLFLIDYLFGSQEQPSSEQYAARGGGQEERNDLLEADPYGAVRYFYKNVALNIPADACARLGDQAAEFARHYAAGECESAVTQLTAEVTDPDSYVGSVPWTAPPDEREQVAGLGPGATWEVDSCDLGITGGPALGTFTLRKVEFKNQWTIAGHTAGPKECP